MDDIAISAFLEEPSEQFLDRCSNDHLVKIVNHYELEVGDRRVKKIIKANLKVYLYTNKVLSCKDVTGVSADVGDPCPPVQDPVVGLSFEQRKELLLLETERLVSLEKKRHDT